MALAGGVGPNAADTPQPGPVCGEYLPEMGAYIRRGRNAYWMPMEGAADWRIRLLKLLDDIMDVLMEKNGI